jgi:hypothetical protein
MPMGEVSALLPDTIKTKAACDEESFSAMTIIWLLAPLGAHIRINGNKGS